MKSLRFASVFVGLVALSLAAISPKAHAQTFTGTFPSAGSSVVGSLGHFSGKVGYFWSVSRGDMVSELFSGTGLYSVTGLDLDFTITDNVLNPASQMVNWDVRVNGTTVGTWSWAATDGTGPVSLSYTFAPIVGNGTYDIGMFVTNEVPSGHGSIAIAEGGTATLHGSAVPEPTSMALLGSGTLGLIARLRRRKNEGEAVEA